MARFDAEVVPALFALMRSATVFGTGVDEVIADAEQLSRYVTLAFPDGQFDVWGLVREPEASARTLIRGLSEFA